MLSPALFDNKRRINKSGSAGKRNGAGEAMNEAGDKGGQERKPTDYWNRKEGNKSVRLLSGGLK